MTEQSFHNLDKNTPIKPPPIGVLPIIQKFVAIYKLWVGYKDNFPKKTKFTLAAKIDLLFLEIVELLYVAAYLNKQEKLPYLQRAGRKIDILKFFLQISWELKSLDNKKYVALSEQLNEIGKMVGGWMRGIQNKTPQRAGK